MGGENRTLRSSREHEDLLVESIGQGQGSNGLSVTAQFTEFGFEEVHMQRAGGYALRGASSLLRG